jgi:hypothetical protein
MRGLATNKVAFDAVERHWQRLQRGEAHGRLPPPRTCD